jgi:hypothetical protein
VSTYGAIAINTTSLSASGNGTSGTSGSGVYLYNAGSTSLTLPSVTLKGVNSFNNNYSDNLQITTLGVITLNSISANDSASGHGASINNSTDGKGVTLTGTNVFNGNYLTGLRINSDGAVTLNNITASGNLNGYGLDSENQLAGSAYAFKLTGTNTFNNNSSENLYVLSKGAISANNVTANFSTGGNGMYLDNTAGSSAGITLTGINTAIGNSGVGISIHSNNGNINLSKVTADGNTGTGLYIDAGTTGNVTLTCGSFTNNGGYGVTVATNGTLTLIGAVSSGNPSGNLFFGGTPIVIRNCP